MEEIGLDAAVIGVATHWGEGRIRVLANTPFEER